MCVYVDWYVRYTFFRVVPCVYLLGTVCEVIALQSSEHNVRDFSSAAVATPVHHAGGGEHREGVMEAREAELRRYVHTLTLRLLPLQQQ